VPPTGPLSSLDPISRDREGSRRRGAGHAVAPPPRQQGREPVRGAWRRTGRCGRSAQRL